jgi:hypothetical protein
LAFVHTRHTTKENGATSATTVFVTLASAVASSSLVFVSVGWASTAGDTITQIKDDQNNTYNLVDLIRNTTNGYSWQTAYLDGVSNAPITITATLSISRTFATIVVGEYTGGLGGVSIDGHAINNQASPATTANAVTSGTFTPVTNNCLIYGTTVDAVSRGAASAGTNFTARLLNQSTSYTTEDRTLAVAAATSATFTNGTATSTAYLTGGIAIKPSTGAASVLRFRKTFSAIGTRIGSRQVISH